MREVQRMAAGTETASGRSGGAGEVGGNGREKCLNVKLVGNLFVWDGVPRFFFFFLLNMTQMSHIYVT